jgi:hypothetical protein
MKITKNERTPTTATEYPRLKVTKDGLVVLFCDHETGTVLSATEHSCSVGYYTDSWNEGNFTTYHGTITLEN